MAPEGRGKYSYKFEKLRFWKDSKDNSVRKKLGIHLCSMQNDEVQELFSRGERKF